MLPFSSDFRRLILTFHVLLRARMSVRPRRCGMDIRVTLTYSVYPYVAKATDR